MINSDYVNVILRNASQLLPASPTFKLEPSQYLDLRHTPAKIMEVDASTSTLTSNVGNYTILRIKRKRNEEPLDALGAPLLYLLPA